MFFQHSNPNLHSYRLQNMSRNGLAFNGSGVRTHSRDHSDTNLHTLYEGGNLSRDCPSTARRSNHMRREAAPANALAPSAASSSALQSGVTNAEFKRISKSASEFATFLRKKGRNEIPTAYDLRALWFANREPPITKRTLSELDLQKLYRCLSLRHDLNFESELQFSPRSDHTAGGKAKQVEAQHYWDAIEIELALYTAYLEDLHLSLRSDSLLDAHCSFPRPRSLEYVPQRLEVMIQEICRIVKSLVPPTKWEAVCSRLNPGLFSQELEHGQYDIEGLFCWVGELLLESCAPSRDARIASMVKVISQGSRDKDAHFLRRGLQDLFSIFEIMKLDAANYQLQLLRDFMISRSIEDERDQIIWRMRNGWDVPNWLLPHSATSPSSAKLSFSTLTMKLISFITHPPLPSPSSSSQPPVPTALALDQTRIQALRSAFQLVTLRASCTHVLASTIHYLGRPNPSPSSSSKEQHHISTLTTSIIHDPTLHFSPTSQRDALVLGIASHAYDLCGQQNRGLVPSPEVLEYVERELDALTTGTETGSEDMNGVPMSVRGMLAERLTEMVEKEVQAVKGLDVGELAGRYTSSSSSSSTSKRAGVVTGPLNVSVEQGSLEDVARRVAHVAILHWRVWAPVLYLSCGDHDEDDGGGDMEPIHPLL